jgi:hypothetical protein
VARFDLGIGLASAPKPYAGSNAYATSATPYPIPS